jgi:hypothetical protein
MKRLSRAEVKEALKAVPIERVLVGMAESGQTRLTPKQIRFAEEIAKGETKAGAYRKSRETKAKPSSASRQGQELMKNPAIVAQVEAFRLAGEAEKLRTPASLRAFTIQKLTEGALSEDFPPAQRVKCLELLGKITEVALFTERKVVEHLTADPEQIKIQLISTLKKALKVDAIDAKLIEGDTLMQEIRGAGLDESSGAEPHPMATPPSEFDTLQDCIHTNPHIESNEAHQPSVLDATNLATDDETNSPVQVNR